MTVVIFCSISCFDIEVGVDVKEATPRNTGHLVRFCLSQICRVTWRRLPLGLFFGRGARLWTTLSSQPPPKGRAVGRVYARWPNCILMKYTTVGPLFGAQNPFAQEAVTAVATCHEFNMADKKPRLIVGTLTYSDAENDITLLAGRLFQLESQDAKYFYKEMEQLHHMLSADLIEKVGKRRPADELVLDTLLTMRAIPM